MKTNGLFIPFKFVFEIRRFVFDNMIAILDKETIITKIPPQQNFVPNNKVNSTKLVRLMEQLLLTNITPKP